MKIFNCLFNGCIQKSTPANIFVNALDYFLFIFALPEKKVLQKNICVGTVIAKPHHKAKLKAWPTSDLSLCLVSIAL